jgi:hypothetical protein
MVVEGEKSWTDGGFLELWLAKILSDSMSTEQTVRFLPVVQRTPMASICSW